MSLTILLAGCAGLMDPMGPPLGLGPGWDELAGIVIIGWVVAIAYRPYGKLAVGGLRTADSVSPQNIVRQRYARSEITHEEFQRMMQHLSQP